MSIQLKKKISKKNIWNIFDDIKDDIYDKDITTQQKEENYNNSVINIMMNGTERNNTDIKCEDDTSCDINMCVECESEIKLCEDGFYICPSNTCGIIYKNILDRSAEWRHYNGEGNMSDPTRCGMPINPLLKESSYGCRIISNMNSSYEMKKIKRYTEWQSMPYKEKSQYDEFEKIKTMANNSGIPKCIIDDALILHKKISQEKTFRALNRHGIIAASIYISGRMNNYPRTAKEISVIFNLDKSSATKGCKNAVYILNKIEKDLKSDNKTTLCNTTPLSFIDRYCSKLNINKELTKLCMFVAVTIEKHNLIPENTPHSVAAGVIYFISQYCNLNVSKYDVKIVSEISEVTINKCCKKLMNYQHLLIPNSIRQKYKYI